MFLRKTISDIFYLIKKIIVFIYLMIKNLPVNYQRLILNIKTYINEFKYKIRNLPDVNINLGIEHLYNNDINDAIVRFKLVEKFLRPGDKLAHYMLGWCYFMKNYPKKAVKHLELSGDTDKINFLDFVKHYGNCKEIPFTIWSQCRALKIAYYLENIYANKDSILRKFIQHSLIIINNVPSKYSVLDLGSNLGVTGYEVRKRFPDTFTLTGFESATNMSDLIEICYPDQHIYDRLISGNLTEFLSQTKDTFDIIISFCFLSFTKDIQTYISAIALLLKPLGYLALLLPMNNLGQNQFELNSKEFTFNLDEVVQNIDFSQFKCLNANKISLNQNSNTSYIHICLQKIN